MMSKINSNKKEVVINAEFEKIQNNEMNSRVLLTPLFILGVIGIIKTGAWGIAFLGYCFSGVQSEALDYGFWWVITIPLLYLIRIPEVFEFLNSWMERTEKFIDRLFS